MIRKVTCVYCSEPALTTHDTHLIWFGDLSQIYTIAGTQMEPGDAFSQQIGPQRLGTIMMWETRHSVKFFWFETSPPSRALTEQMIQESVVPSTFDTTPSYEYVTCDTRGKAHLWAKVRAFAKLPGMLRHWTELTYRPGAAGFKRALAEFEGCLPVPFEPGDNDDLDFWYAF
jgi:hypothetical protein